jgi:hypothetical protein
MTAHTSPRATGVAARVRGLVALDGAVASTMLTVFGFFTVSVSFAACLVPAVAFAALVGWQPTHLALWLGAASLLPLAPATYALLRSTRRLLVRASDARAAREFWVAFASGCRGLAWAAVGTSAVVLLLSYDLALFGASDAMLLFTAAAAALVVALLIGVCAVAAAQQGPRPVEMLTIAVRAVARRPHIALSWLLLIALGAGIASLPIVGAPVALFLPALIGAGIHICNHALQLGVTDETRKTP